MMVAACWCFLCERESIKEPNEVKPLLFFILRLLFKHSLLTWWIGIINGYFSMWLLCCQVCGEYLTVYFRGCECFAMGFMEGRREQNSQLFISILISGTMNPYVCTCFNYKSHVWMNKVLYWPAGYRPAGFSQWEAAWEWSLAGNTNTRLLKPLVSSGDDLHAAAKNNEVAFQQCYRTAKTCLLRCLTITRWQSFPVLYALLRVRGPVSMGTVWCGH